MNLAYYHKKDIKWDPKRNDFACSSGDEKWLSRDYRVLGLSKNNFFKLR